MLATLEELADKTWFHRHGALVQELVPPQGYDLRVLVAANRALGAIYRVAAEGEWRTNIALGGTRSPVPELPLAASTLAIDAARATGTSLAGVDLLPCAEGEWTVLEVNGAVEFTREYETSGDVFAEVRSELAHAVRATFIGGAETVPVQAA